MTFWMLVCMATGLSIEAKKDAGISSVKTLFCARQKPMVNAILKVYLPNREQRMVELCQMRMQVLLNYPHTTGHECSSRHQ